jgi:hypothetical protein
MTTDDLETTDRRIVAAQALIGQLRGVVAAIESLGHDAREPRLRLETAQRQLVELEQRRAMLLGDRPSG